jgi:circadian clock protein KaiC
MIARQIDLLKARGVTTMVTTLDQGGELTTMGVSSLVDTWLLLRNVENNGERNRLLSVVKSRGSAHSNQVREFRLTSHGIELIDVYMGAGGVLAGSARLAQEAAERDAELRRAEDRRRRQRELRLSVAKREARLAVVQEQLNADQAELDQIGLNQRQQSAGAATDRLAMVRQRGADAVPANGERR